MRAKLIINGADFSIWARESGIKQSQIERKAVSVVTLDGIEHRKSVLKLKIDVELVEMRDATLRTLMAALSSPADVLYTTRSGEDRTGVFYISGPTATEKTVRGNTTFWNGVSFALEEK